MPKGLQRKAVGRSPQAPSFSYWRIQSSKISEMRLLPLYLAQREIR